jgi:hypothetical protein
MFAALHKLFHKNKNRRANRPLAGSCRVRLHVEALEQRDVPTVLFQPHFGPETLVSSNPAQAAMPHPTVNLVFSGDYWTTANGQQDQAMILNSAKNILTGPFLSGLTQYGSDGTATLGTNWVESETANGNQPTGGALVQNLLQDSLSKHHVNVGFNDLKHGPIYVVISDPASAGGYNGGWNSSATYEYSVYSPAYREVIDYTEHYSMAWIGTSSSNGKTIDKDAFTSMFSHEIAEKISDPDSNGIWVKKPDAEPLDMGGQISDNEPELGWVHYGYRLGGDATHPGDLVQPYWSVRDQAYIVPDGNAQTFTLTPVWDDSKVWSIRQVTYHGPNGTTFTVPVKVVSSDPGAGFVGVYDLTVAGDQFAANFADNIQVMDGGQSNPTVFLNGERATFDAGAIRTINVNTFGGANTVQVLGVGARVTVSIDSWGSTSNDTVTLGNNGSLAGIQGTVNVANQSGHTSLVVNDYADAAPTVTVTDHSLAFSNLPATAHINYTAASWGTDGQLHGVTSLRLHEAPGSVIDVESLGAWTDTYVDWYPGLLGWGSQPGLLRGPAAGKVHVLFPVTKAV